MVAWTKMDQTCHRTIIVDHFMRMGNGKKKLLEVQEGRTKRWEVGRRRKI